MINTSKVQVIHIALLISIFSACRSQESLIHQTADANSSEITTNSAVPLITPTKLISKSAILTPSPTLSNQSAKEIFVQWILGNPDCKLPCWGGIAIGKTSLDDAYYLLNPVLQLKGLKKSACRLGQCKWYPWIYLLDEKLYSGAVLSKDDGAVYAITVDGDYSDKVSLGKLLSSYGNPDKTFVYAHTGLPPDNIALFDLLLLYSQQKFVVRYRWLTQSSGNNIKACGEPQYFTLSIVQHNESDWTDLEIDQAAHQVKYSSQTSNIRSFQDSTGVVTDYFFERVLQGDPSLCISTPLREWGG